MTSWRCPWNFASVPPVVSTTALGSAFGADVDPGGASRGLSWRATNAANRTPNTATIRRALRCQRAMNVLTAECRLLIRLLIPHSINTQQSEISNGQLYECLTIVLILLEREGDVERGFVLDEIVVALGRAPGDRAKNAAVLLERHLQVSLL